MGQIIRIHKKVMAVLTDVFGYLNFFPCKITNMDGIFCVSGVTSLSVTVIKREEKIATSTLT